MMKRSRSTVGIDPRDHFERQLRSRQSSDVFDNHYFEYNVSLRTVDDTTVPDLDAAIRAIFRELLSDILEKVGPTERKSWLQISLISQHFPNGNIDFDFIPLDDLDDTIIRLQEEISRKLVSSKEFRLDRTFIFAATIQRLPGGGGGHGHYKGASVDIATFIKKKTCISTPIIDEGLCLPACLAVAMNRIIWGAKMTTIYRRGSIQLRTDAKELLDQAGLRPGTLGVPELEKLANLPVLADYSIGAFDVFGLRYYYKRVRPHTAELNILLAGDCYHVVSSPKALLCRDNYCSECGKGFKRKTHQCDASGCLLCKQRGCQNGQTRIVGHHECPDCHIIYKTESCLMAHDDTCGERLRCMVCSSVDRKERFDNDGCHKNCGEFFCKTCHKHVPKNGKHKFCYVPKYEFQDSDYDPLLAVFDFETVKQDGGILVPVLACLQNVGEMTTRSFWRDGHDDAAVKLLRHILANSPADKKRKRIYLAHSSATFDSYCILKGLIKLRQIPQLTCVGRRILQIHLPKQHIFFRDTFLYMPLPLRKLGPAFNIEMKKGHFPYSWLTPEYENTVTEWPDKEDYDMDRLDDGDKEEFNMWFQAAKDRYDVFDWNEQLESYCIDDVRVLAGCVESCGRTMGSLTGGVNLFAAAATMASFLNKIYRAQYLPDAETLVVVPEGGFNSKYRNQSRLGSLYLDWLGVELDVELEREVRVGRYYVDATFTATKKISERRYKDVEPGSIVIIEVNGCHIHGHECMGGPDAPLPMTNATNGERQQLTADRAGEIATELGAIVVSIPTCEIKAEALTNDSLRGYLDEHRYSPPMSGRAALYGGHVNTFKTICKAPADGSESIYYADVNSLYPWCNSYANYPVGEPTISTRPQTLDLEKLGIHHVLLQPPTSEMFPILPYRTKKGLLTFSLCRTCAEESSQEQCLHTDEERQFAGAYTNMELDKAVEQGYQILHVFKSWVWNRSSDQLFRPMIFKFYIQKLLASGIPQTCDPEEYIARVNGTFGCQHTAEDFKYNSGMRLIAKIAINSIWGRFSIRSDRTNAKLIKDFAGVVKLFNNPECRVQGANVVSEQLLLATYRPKDLHGCAPVIGGSLAVGVFTTSAARLKLAEGLATLRPHEAVYADTDSLIFIRKGGPPPQLDIGSQLGQWEHEKSSGKIRAFCSTGAKSYCIEWVDDQGNVHEEVKCKGFSMRSRGGVTLATMEQLVNHEIDELEVVDRNIISRDLLRVSLQQKPESTKKLRLTCDKKRQLMDNDRFEYSTVPFGFRSLVASFQQWNI